MRPVVDRKVIMRRIPVPVPLMGSLVTAVPVIAATVPKCEYHVSRSEAFTNAVNEKTASKRCLGQVLARVRAVVKSSEGHGYAVSSVDYT